MNPITREKFEQWCDETGKTIVEHYYLNGSQTRRVYPSALHGAFNAGVALGLEMAREVAFKMAHSDEEAMEVSEAISKLKDEVQHGRAV